MKNLISLDEFLNDSISQELETRLSDVSNLCISFQDKEIVGDILYLNVYDKEKHLRPLIIYHPTGNYQCIITNDTIDCFLEAYHEDYLDDIDYEDESKFYFISEK